MEQRSYQNRNVRRNRRRKANANRFQIRMQKKLVVLFLIILLAFIGLSVKLIYINKVDGERYKKQILSQQEYDSKTLPYKRGEIVDANGTKLAYSEKVYNLIIDAKAINNSKKENVLSETLQALDQYFDLDINAISNYISQNANSQYYVAAKQLEYETVAPFQEAKQENSSIVGVWFEEEYKRKYPYNTLASSVIGFTGSDNNGTYGLEEYYNTTLNGTNGREYGYLTEDSTLERTTIAAQDGCTLVTSLDTNIQNIVEKYMKQFNEEHKGEYRPDDDGCSNMGVIVMNPQTGEIMAMSDYPNFDLNNPKDLTPFYSEEEIAQMDDEAMYDALNRLWRNYCISDTYEPGSVAKAMTVAAGLDSGKLTGNETYVCNGVLEVSGHPIKCHKHIGHGVVNISQALEQSCNVALMHMGEQMGKETLMKYLYNFNIGLKTNIDLSGEARTNTLVYNVDDMVASDLAISTFGQGYNVTMIQMAAAFSSIINGGKYYQPHVVTEIKSADGTTVEKIEPRMLKQVISSTTSDTMKTYLANVCSEGTGSVAVPAGYLIGGKTGTAEKQPRGNGNYVVSFMGFAPVDDPQVVVYVVIDEPNVESQPHSSYAQEVAKNIFTEILPYLNVFRTEELSEEDIEQLQKLHILPGADTEDTSSDENNGDGESTDGQDNGEGTEGGNPEVTYQVDPQTGNVIDPNSGQQLDPNTFEPVDPKSSDLDGLTGVENKPQDETEDGTTDIGVDVGF